MLSETCPARPWVSRAFFHLVKRKGPRQAGQVPNEGHGKGRAFALNSNLLYLIRQLSVLSVRAVSKREGTAYPLHPQLKPRVTVSSSVFGSGDFIDVDDSNQEAPHVQGDCAMLGNLV